MPSSSSSSSESESFMSVESFGSFSFPSDFEFESFSDSSAQQDFEPSNQAVQATNSEVTVERSRGRPAASQTCDICRAICKNSKSLYDHKREKHQDNILVDGRLFTRVDGKFTCDACSKSFVATSAIFKTHRNCLPPSTEVDQVSAEHVANDASLTWSQLLANHGLVHSTDAKCVICIQHRRILGAKLFLNQFL